MFKIEDEQHAEPLPGEYVSLDEAMAALRRLSRLPWDQPPNRCSCTNWRTCHRRYDIIEYDSSRRPWRELQRLEVLELGAAGVRWLRPDAAD